MSTESPSKPLVPNSIAWLFISVIAVTACVVFPCGIGIGWMGRGWSAAPAAPLAKGGEGKIGVKDSEWTFQAIQDHLAKKGWQTSRAAAEGGMIYQTGDGKPLNIVAGGLDEPGLKEMHLSGEHLFFATEFPSSQEAMAFASRTKDVAQTSVYAWKNFSIRCSPKTWGKLNKMLP